MSVSVNNLLSLFNTYYGDDTNERIDESERLQYLTEAVTDIKQTMKSAMSNMTYPLTYIPGIHSYKISPGIYNVLAAGDMRVQDMSNRIDTLPITISSPSDLLEDVANKKYNNSYAIDRYDGDLYLMMSYMPEGNKTTLSSFSELEGVINKGDTGIIEVDKNLGGLKLSIDTSSTVDDFAGLQSAVELNLDTYKDIGAVGGHVFLEDKTNVTSIEVRLGTDDSNYYSFTTTSAFNESGFKNEWNMFVIEWKDSTVVGTPDITDLNVLDVIVNYSSGQSDMVVRFDDFFIAKPINLKFHYISYSVGKDSVGNEIVEFTDVSDIPYFSGQFDNLKYVASRMATALAFYDLSRPEEAQIQEFKANQKMKQIRTMIPSNHRKELKAFRPTGATMRRGFRR